jgi:hypothetical protein
MKRAVPHRPSTTSDTAVADNNATQAATLAATRKPPMVNEDTGKSFQELKGFARIFIVQFNMFGPDMSVEKVAALSEEGKLKLRAFVPSQLYLTAYTKKAFKKTLTDEVVRSSVEMAHARRILSKFYPKIEDVDSKVAPFVAETRKLKKAIAKFGRATMRHSLLLEARLVHDRKYNSIPKYTELVQMCATDKGLQGTVLDLLNSTVYPRGHFPKYKR